MPQGDGEKGDGGRRMSCGRKERGEKNKPARSSLSLEEKAVSWCIKQSEGEGNGKAGKERRKRPAVAREEYENVFSLNISRPDERFVELKR